MTLIYSIMIIANALLVVVALFHLSKCGDPWFNRERWQLPLPKIMVFLNAVLTAAHATIFVFTSDVVWAVLGVVNFIMIIWFFRLRSKL